MGSPVEAHKDKKQVTKEQSNVKEEVSSEETSRACKAAVKGFSTKPSGLGTHHAATAC